MSQDFPSSESHEARPRRWGIGICLALVALAGTAAIALSTSRRTPPGVGATAAVSSTVAGDTHIKTTVNSSTSSSRSDNTHWSQRSIDLFVTDADPGTRQLADALMTRLGTNAGVRTVTLHGADVSPPTGQPLPNVFIQLRAQPLEPANGRQRKWLLTMSDQWERSNHTTQNTSTPPVSQLMYRAEITLSKDNGDLPKTLSPSALAGATAKINEAITAVWSNLNVPTLPAPGALPDLYPAFEPPVDIPLLKTHQAILKVSGSGLCRPTYAAWEFTAPHDATKWYEADRAAMAADGWTAPEKPEPDRLVANFGRNGVSCQLFRKAVATWDGQGGENVKTPETCVFVLSYERTWHENEYAAALEKAISTGNEPEINLLTQFWYLRRPAIEAWLKTHRPTTVAGWLVVAHFAKVDDHQEDQRKALIQAKTLSLLFDDGRDAGSIDQRAKEAGLEELPKFPDDTILQSLGIPTVSSKQPFEVPLTVGAPIFVHLADDRADWRVFVKITAEPVADTQTRITSSVLSWERYGSGKSSTGIVVAGDARTIRPRGETLFNTHLNDDHFEGTLTPGETRDVYHITIRRSNTAGME